ncbi:ATP-binding protein [Desulfurivibrio alkaliphilus]|uniref:PP-loop domain protein n=1 Tax=Desulfurivibrio alkaliphilus (strain DSM 19089 / UNIQEM U267 / AHT2) TaxID=589865 RepID=D6YZP9_DESAT|nr:ATP-binding protein [Desulfurivibrio alkaliphilus]ADH85056.1 PP-loop domain protein [Desulfurivibrio alkaliphilus AHT 2]
MNAPSKPASQPPPGGCEEAAAKPTRLPAEINRLVGKAMHRYGMLADGDRVMIAVSGGIDSLVLCRLLDLWRRKAPIHYELLPVHLDMGFAGYRPRPGLYGGGPLPPEAGALQADGLLPPLPGTGAAVQEQLEKLGLPYLIEETTYGPEALAAEEGKNGCYHCSSRRRNRLFALAREHNCNKLALGHHQEDIIETFFLNLLYGGNISTMIPNQRLFAGRLHLIRPLALLSKEMIQQLGRLFAVAAVPNPCPLTDLSKRHTVRTMVRQLTADDPRITANIFAALGNVRSDYLL